MKKNYLFLGAMLICVFALTCSLCYAWFSRGNSEVSGEAGVIESTTPGDIQIDIDDKATSFDFPIIGDGLIPCAPIGAGIDGVSNDEWFVPSCLPTKIGERCCYGFDVSVFSSANFLGTKRVAIQFKVEKAGDAKHSHASQRLAENIKCAAVLLKGAEIGVDQLVAHDNYSVYDLETSDRIESGEKKDDFYYEFKPRTEDNPSPNQKIRVMVWVDAFVTRYADVANGEATIKVSFLDKTPGSGNGDTTNAAEVANEFWALYTGVRDAQNAVDTDKADFDRVIDAYDRLTPDQKAELAKLDTANEVEGNIGTWRALSVLVGKYKPNENEENVLYSNYNAISEVVGQYNALTDFDKLSSAVTTKIETWKNQIQALGDITMTLGAEQKQFLEVYYAHDGEGLTADNKATLDALVDAYDNLSATNKTIVDAFHVDNNVNKIAEQIDAWRAASANYDANQTAVNAFMELYNRSAGKHVANSTSAELGRVVTAYNDDLTDEQRALLADAVKAEVTTWATDNEALNDFMTVYNRDKAAANADDAQDGNNESRDAIRRAIISAYDSLVEAHPGIIDDDQVNDDIQKWKNSIASQGIDFTWNRSDVDASGTNADGIWITDADKLLGSTNKENTVFESATFSPATSRVYKLGGTEYEELKADAVRGVSISVKPGVVADYKQANDADADNIDARALGIGYMVRAGAPGSDTASNFMTITLPDGFVGTVTVMASPFWSVSTAGKDANRFVALNLAKAGTTGTTIESNGTADEMKAGWYIVQKGGNTEKSEQFKYEFTVSEGGTYYLSNVAHSKNTDKDKNGNSRATVYVSSVNVNGNIKGVVIPDDVQAQIAAFKNAVDAINPADITEDNLTVTDAAVEAYRAIDEQYRTVKAVLDIRQDFRPNYNLANNVKNFAQKVGEISDPVTLNDGAAIEAAEALYSTNFTTAEDQARVSKAYAKLTAAREAYNELLATKHTVTFDLNGGTGSIEAQQVTHNETATRPTDEPTKENYTFAGWFTAAEGGESFNFTSGITADTIIYAHWTLNSYEVKFELNYNGSAGTYATQTIDHGEKATVPAEPERTAYTFVGWYTEAACENAFDFNTAITEVKTLYAKWEKVDGPTTVTATWDKTVAQANGLTWIKDGDSQIPNEANSKAIGINNDQVLAANGDVKIIAVEGKTTADYKGTGDEEGNASAARTNGVNYMVKAAGSADGFIKIEVPAGFNGTVALSAATYKKDGTAAKLSLTEENGSAAETKNCNCSNPCSVVAGTSHSFTFNVNNNTNATKTYYISNGNEKTTVFVSAITVSGTVGGGTVTPDPTEYTVTFDLNYTGAAAPTTAQTVNGMVTEPADPSRDGYTFGGWFTETGTTAFDFATEITENITLYAKWNEVTATTVSVAWNASDVESGKTWLGNTPASVAATKVDAPNSDVTLATTTNVTITVDKDAVVADCSEAKLLSLIRVSKGANDFATIKVPKGFTGSIIVVGAPYMAGTGRNAKLHLSTTAGGTGGSTVTCTDSTCCSLETNSHSFEFKITEPTTAETTYYLSNKNTGYTIFISSISVQGTITDGGTADPTTCEVTFNANGGSVTPTTAQAASGKVASLPTPTRSGYTFNGWFTEEACTNAFVASTTVKRNITLYAKWTQNTVTPEPTTYTVTFDANGGTVTPTAKETVDGKVTELPTPQERPGYTFNGWYTAAEGGGEFTTDTVVEADMTVYAHWTRNTYTVTFNSDGGSAVEAQTVAVGTAFTMPNAPSKIGYDFLGWFNAADEKVETAYAADSDITLKAKWQVKTYTVTFNLNGGTGSINAQTINHGEKASEPADPTRNGYTFDGWFTETGTTAFDFANTEITDNITLYAKWTIKTYTVTFDSNGGSAVEAQTINHGEKASEPADPTRNGYTFGGWFTETGTTAFDFATEITDNITLYARWEEVTATTNVSVAWNASDVESGKTWLGNTPAEIGKGKVDALANGTTKTLSPTGAEATISVKGGNSTVVADCSEAKLLSLVKVKEGTNDFATIVVPKGFKGSIIVVGAPYQHDSGARNAKLHFSTTANGTGGKTVTCEDSTYCSLATKSHALEFEIATATTEETTYYLSNKNTGYTIFISSILVSNQLTSEARANAAAVITEIGKIGTVENTDASRAKVQAAENAYNALTAEEKALVTNYVALRAACITRDGFSVTNYTVTFNLNYTGAAAPTTAQTVNGKVASLPTPTKDGYTFNGWYTAATGGTQFTTSTTVTRNMTVYAHWTENTGTTTTEKFSFDSDSTGWTSTVDMQYSSGYTDTGWQTKSNIALGANAEFKTTATYTGVSSISFIGKSVGGGGITFSVYVGGNLVKTFDKIGSSGSKSYTISASEIGANSSGQIKIVATCTGSSARSAGIDEVAITYTSKTPASNTN